MIVGIGIDVAEVDRFERAVSLHGDSFLGEFLSDQEMADCRAKRSPFPSYAVRFAAKEAFAKALGTGIIGPMSWHDVEVRLGPKGRPALHLGGSARRSAESLGIDSVHLSLSHEKDCAAAVVVLECGNARR